MKIVALFSSRIFCRCWWNLDKRGIPAPCPLALNMTKRISLFAAFWSLTPCNKSSAFSQNFCEFLQRICPTNVSFCAKADEVPFAKMLKRICIFLDKTGRDLCRKKDNGREDHPEPECTCFCDPGYWELNCFCVVAPPNALYKKSSQISI